MNRQIRLRAVGRPESCSSDVGQNVVIRCLHLRNRVHDLVTVSRTEKAGARVVKERALFQVVRPVGNGDGVAGLAVRFNRVLVAS